ncbi:MAG: hypothetical protein AB7N70_32140 [Dehalococcoidia bacterium]
MTALAENSGTQAPPDHGFFEIISAQALRPTYLYYEMYVRAPLSLADVKPKPVKPKPPTPDEPETRLERWRAHRK